MLKNSRRAVAAAPVLCCLLLALLMLAPGTGHAQLVEQVEVERLGPEAEIRIHFATTLQYLSHFPEGDGEFLRIRVLLTGALENYGGRTIQESHTAPTGGLVPKFTVSYPEEGETVGVRFERRVRFRVRPGPDGRSIYVYVPLPPALAASPPPKPVAPGPAAVPAPQTPRPPAPPIPAPALGAAPSPGPGVPADVEADARKLIAQARADLDRNDLKTAIETLNRLLNMPPSSVSREAQELIGVARERDGDFSKARAEYELYLRLYPSGEGTQRVRQRLRALPVPAFTPGARRAAPRPEKTEITTFGSFSQYYYYGATKFDSTLVAPQPGLQLDRASLLTTDQKSLVTSAYATSRIRSQDADSKFVFRDIDTDNFLPGKGNLNRLYAMYYERQSADTSFLSRIGRQPGLTGGLPTRFDGLLTGYTFRPGLRLNAVAGSPVEFYPTEHRNFVGINADIGPIAERWTTNVFWIAQRVEGLLDRRAVGAEARYFSASSNVFTLYDYDTLYKRTNIAMLQGNWTTDGGTIYTLLMDHRRIPPLQLTNVLLGESETIPGVTTPTIRELLDAGRTLEDLRQGAVALTPTSNQFLVGFTHPTTPKLQLGANFQISNVSGTEASGDLPAMAGTGNIYVYSVQAIKTGFLSNNGTGVANASYIEAMTYRGETASFTHMLLWSAWRLDASVRWYRQRSDLDVTMERTSPTLRLGYHTRNNLTFEVEAGVERTTDEGPTQLDRTTRKYFSLGYRWDFF